MRSLDVRSNEPFARVVANLKSCQLSNSKPRHDRDVSKLPPHTIGCNTRHDSSPMNRLAARARNASETVTTVLVEKFQPLQSCIRS